LKIKVCGLCDSQNIVEIASLGPDYLGFIFYSKSKRKADVETLKRCFLLLPKGIKKVGVFVNETGEQILEIAKALDLDVIQLHGNESLELGLLLKMNGLQVWKVFGLKTEEPNWTSMEGWLEACDAFLFDTATSDYGGSGLKFSHHVLENYPFVKPFWLSGGIGSDFLTLPRFFERLPLLGLDINSMFESEPGMKKIEEVKTFIKHWKS